MAEANKTPAPAPTKPADAGAAISNREVENTQVDPTAMSPPGIVRSTTAEKPVVTSGRFRLDTDHYWHTDQRLEAGTIVGDDTEYPLPEGWKPSSHMTPVDEDGFPLDQDGKRVRQGRAQPRGLPGQGGRR